MKTTTSLLLLFLFVIVNAMGQSPLFSNKKSFTLGVQLSNPEKPSSSDYYAYKGETSNDKSYAVALVYKYGLSETVNLRVKTGMTKINVAEQTPEESNLDKETQYRFSVGAEYRYTIKRASLLYGADMVYDYYGVYTNHNVSLINAYPPDTYTIPAGRSTGVSALLGFDIRLCRFLSFGFEYTPGIFYSKLGGTIKGNNFSSWQTYETSYQIKQRIFFGIAFILNSKKI